MPFVCQFKPIHYHSVGKTTICHSITILLFQCHPTTNPLPIHRQSYTQPDATQPILVHSVYPVPLDWHWIDTGLTKSRPILTQSKLQSPIYLKELALLTPTTLSMGWIHQRRSTGTGNTNGSTIWKLTSYLDNSSPIQNTDKSNNIPDWPPIGNKRANSWPIGGQLRK